MHEVRRPGREVRRDRAEALPGVVGHVDVRRVVVAPVVVEGHVEAVGVVTRRLDPAHVRALRNALEAIGEFDPLRPLRRPPDASVVRPRVQFALVQLRLGERDDRGEVLRSRDVRGDAARRVVGDLDLLRIGVGEVVGDRRHLIRVVRPLQDPVRPDVQRLRIVRRQFERRVPVEPHVVERRILRNESLQLLDLRHVRRRGIVRVIARQDRDRIAQRLRALAPIGLLQLVPLARARVPPVDPSLLRFPEHDVRVRRVLWRVEAVAAPDRIPHVIVDGPAGAAAGAAPRIVVLQSAADAIGRVHVVADRVKLPHRDPVREFEVAAPVPRDRDAAVVAQYEVIRIGRVPPQRVIVHVHALGRVPHRAAPVPREEERRPVDEIGVVRRHPDAGIVEGP